MMSTIDTEKVRSPAEAARKARLPALRGWNLQYLEIREIGSSELQGGIHFLLKARRSSIKAKACYKCSGCNRVFLTEMD